MVRGRILVVDDEPAARDALAEVLRKEHYALETAGDAFKALGKLERFAADLVLTDLWLPGMNGIELTGKVRGLDPDAAVVVVTACATLDAAVAAMRAGARDYMTKPLDVGELCAVIERELSERRRRREQRAAHDGPGSPEASAPPADVPSPPIESAPAIPGATLADIERYAILRTLEASGGSTTRAADVLGISVRKIQYKLQEFGAARKSGIPAVSRAPNEPPPVRER
jgi:DNA-binding NtrC family response regulator